jgi:uncharacterized protein YgfB (UPF0149 family)
MNKPASQPSYDELTQLLDKNLPNHNAAQTHGLLCGYICLNPEDPNPLATLFPKLKLKNKTAATLKEVYEISFHQLNEFSFEFELILPDDECDINIRAEALGLWCQGFLTQIEKADPKLSNQISNEVAEALNDFTEIAKINFGEIATNEEDETAYYELAEYVRLSILMIYNELQGLKAPTVPSQETTSIH